MLLIVLVVAANGFIDAQEDATAWLKKAIVQAGTWYPPVPVRVDWEVEQLSPLTDKEFAELAALVRDRPEHPQRGEYQRALAQRTGQKSIMQFSVAAADASRWRYNLKGGIGSYIDQGQSGSEVWQLSEPALTVGRNGDSAVFRPDVGRADARRMLLNVFAGGIQSSDAAPWSIVSMSRRDNGNFAAVVKQPGVHSDKPLGTLVFRWDEHLRRGFTERFEWPPGSDPGGYERFEGWKQLEDDVWCCTKIQSIDSLGRMYAECRVTDARVISTADVKTLTAAPSMGAEDPYRGKVSPRQFVSYDRDGAATVRGSDGTVRTRAPSPQSVPRSTWSVTGWTIAVLLAIGTAFIRYRQRQNA